MGKLISIALVISHCCSCLGVNMVTNASSTYAAAAAFAHHPPSPSSSRPGKGRLGCCYNKAAECVCSACVLSVCCPISLAWCCIKIPCEIGWSLAQNAKRKGTCCGGSQGRISSASYSSFSDMDSDDIGLAEKRNDSCEVVLVAPAKKRWPQRTRWKP